MGLLVPRQNGKGGILEARELAGLYLFIEPLILHSAHEFKTSAEAFLRTLELIQNNPELESEIKNVRTSHGEEGIELQAVPALSVAGSPVRRSRSRRLRFVARSKTSGRGFTGDTVVLDEAFALTKRQVGALLPTMSARPNWQVWYVSTQGDDTAIELNKVRRRGHEGGRRLAFFEWSAEEDADLDDRRAWRQANPAFGIRIFEETIETEREALDEEEFARERLGIKTIGIAKSALPVTLWRSIEDPDVVPTEPYAFGVDVLPDRSAGSIVVAGAGETLELVEHRRGTGWIASRAIALARKWKGPIVVDARGPAASIADQITKKASDVAVQRLSSSDLADACGRLYDAVVDKTISVRPSNLFRAAASGAVKRDVGDRFVWSRSRSAADVTPLVAASLALAAEEETDSDFAFVV